MYLKKKTTVSLIFNTELIHKHDIFEITTNAEPFKAIIIKVFKDKLYLATGYGEMIIEPNQVKEMFKI